ncbi:pygopus homolog 2-like isoform X2 [Lytechinus variegatus]|uniref:pygopus homolog 2-like isoform X2 n=1 Tax=Lytechinus variegatus TaxID=7654 RepID=UPI001BB16B1C|nr:pygopus homolog 2-like isoform X2 [Lytechinus variegatus]
MPREKKTTKRLRTSTDSERENTDSSKGSSTSQPPSPTKKRKKPPGLKGPGSGSGGGNLAPPPTPSGDNIVASNPFEDDPSGATATARGLNLLTRRLGRTAAMNNQFGPYGNSFHHQHGMPPGGGGGGGGGPYPNNMANSHNSNGPMPPMMYNNPQTLFPCGICHQQVQDSEDAVICVSSCHTWFHRICTGMTTTAYTLLNSEHAAEWVCDRCVREKKIPLVRLKTQPIT